MPEAPDFDRPIFIVGCPRSGTTLVRLVVDSHPNISCGPETQFLIGLAKIEQQYLHLVQNYGIDREEWSRRLVHVFRSFHVDYARKRGRKRWGDKDPGYVKRLDYIDHHFPDCQVVHVIRNGLDVVDSHKRSWGYRSALRAIKTWPKRVRDARRAGVRIGADRSLFEFLGEPWDPVVLEFYNRDHHDAGEDLSKLARDRVEVGGNAFSTNKIGSGAKELDPMMKLFFRLKAGAVMRELGYW